MAAKVVRNDWLEEETGELARDGFRTLVVAKKILTADQYKEFEAIPLKFWRECFPDWGLSPLIFLHCLDDQSQWQEIWFLKLGQLFFYFGIFLQKYD